MTASEEVRKRRDFVRQFSVMLPNRVGAFASLLKLLSSRKVEVIGLSIQDASEATISRLVFSDPDSAEELFMEQGIPYTLSELVVVVMKECGVDLNRSVTALNEAETNLHYAFPLMVQHQGQALLAMFLEDIEFGASVLNQAGMSVVYEDELLR